MINTLYLSPSGLTYQHYIGPNSSRSAVCASVLKLFFDNLGPTIRLRVERYPFKGSKKFWVDGLSIYQYGTFNRWTLTDLAVEALQGYSIIYVRATNDA